MELNIEWAKAFNYSFETGEEVVDFIIDNLDTRNFGDSYVDAAGYGEPNECFKETVDDKKELLRDFLIYLLTRAKDDITDSIPGIILTNCKGVNICQDLI